MIRTSVVFLLCLSGCAWAQIMSGTASMRGVSYSYETRLEPPGPGRANIGGGTLTNTAVHRHLCDFNSKKYFGYDLVMEPVGGGQYRFTFSPLSLTPEKIEEIYDNVKGWSPLALPHNPETQVVSAGDTITLDLFVNPETGQKIVEYIRVHERPGRPLSPQGPAKDFSIEEVGLHISAPRLSINGKPLDPAATRGAAVSGAPLWIYVSSYGRFTFSLAPRPDIGMLKAGEIRGVTMIWRWGNDEFSLAT